MVEHHQAYVLASVLVGCSLYGILGDVMSVGVAMCVCFCIVCCIGLYISVLCLCVTAVEYRVVKILVF